MLFLIFLVAAGVIARFSIRFRGLLLSKPRGPTPDADVWKMHKLPAGVDGEGPNESGGDDDHGR